MYRSVQVMGYADDINILGRSRAAINEAHTALENQAKTVGLNINTDKTNAVVQTRKQCRDKVIHLNNTDIEIVDSFTYLGSIMNIKNDEIIEIERRILMANRAYFSIIHLVKSRTIHLNNKIRICKTIIRPILCYGCELGP
jgi:sorting nexin-29